MDDVPADFDWSDSENEAQFKPKGKSIFKTLKKKGKKGQNEAENAEGENADKSPSQSPKKGKNNLFKKKNKKEKALANKFEASIKAEADAKAAAMKEEELKVEEFKIEDFKLEEDKVDEPAALPDPRVEEADEIKSSAEALPVAKDTSREESKREAIQSAAVEPKKEVTEIFEES